nr:MAG TPA: hypothetical protein [Caudoviricetes sp.]
MRGYPQSYPLFSRIATHQRERKRTENGNKHRLIKMI